MIKFVTLSGFAVLNGQEELIMEQLIAFLTGSCLASFIVTMTQRHLLEMGPSSPRSLCDHCAHPLAWWQLIPLVGFALQLGRCRWCKSHRPLVQCVRTNLRNVVSPIHPS